MIGLVATESGAALARAWASAVGMLLGLGIAWAAMFAVGALLIGDAGTAGPLIAGHSDFGTLIGGLLLAVAGLASLWLCLKVAREAVSLLRMQLGGLLVARAARAAPRAAPARAAAPRAAVARPASRCATTARGSPRGAAAAGGELAAAGPGRRGAERRRPRRRPGRPPRDPRHRGRRRPGRRASRLAPRAEALDRPLARRRGRRADGPRRDRRLAEPDPSRPRSRAPPATTRRPRTAPRLA